MPTPDSVKALKTDPDLFFGNLRIPDPEGGSSHQVHAELIELLQSMFKNNANNRITSPDIVAKINNILTVHHIPENANKRLQTEYPPEILANKRIEIGPNSSNRKPPR